MSLIGFWNKLWKRDAAVSHVSESEAEDMFWDEMFEPRKIIGPLCWQPRINWRKFWREAGISEPLDLSHVNREMWWGATGSYRAEDLRAAIDTARRNKKKSSHLVAELAELENGK